jgi:hypothetical protein
MNRDQRRRLTKQSDPNADLVRQLAAARLKASAQPPEPVWDDDEVNEDEHLHAEPEPVTAWLPTPIEDLATLHLEVLSAVDRRTDAVARAHRSGSTWEAIGLAMSMTRQAAHERYASTMRSDSGASPL